MKAMGDPEEARARRGCKRSSRALDFDLLKFRFVQGRKLEGGGGGGVLT